ncbi:uncharacterized protein LOC135839449 isoform X1 [Planococcus citri]|uniref:uncharacterized protein LOC135839449 isoform X1 n=1 Tax=Planococcus citri TaxID=170843 RepID=UPI0031F7A2A5
MARYALIPYMVFVLYSATSFGWTDNVYDLKNNTAFIFPYQLNVSIYCSDTSEVEWKIDSTDQTTNFIEEVSPNEKILKIKKITPYDTGIYKCVSKKNSNLFKRLIFTIHGLQVVNGQRLSEILKRLVDGSKISDQIGDRLNAAGLPKYKPPSLPYTGHISLETST